MWPPRVRKLIPSNPSIYNCLQQLPGTKVLSQQYKSGIFGEICLEIFKIGQKFDDQLDDDDDNDDDEVCV